MSDTNLLKKINELDKDFYNKLADMSIINLYNMENITNIAMVNWQNGLSNIQKSFNGVMPNKIFNDMMKLMEKNFNDVQTAHQDFINKISIKYNKYIDSLLEKVWISRLCNIGNYKIIKSRAFLSEKKYKDIFYKVIEESKEMKNSFYNNAHDLIDYYFKVISDKELEKINHNNQINISTNISNIIKHTKIHYEKIFKQKDIIKYLEANGFTYKNTGRHNNYSNGTYTIPVPNHGSKDLGFGLQRKIQKDVINIKEG